MPKRDVSQVTPKAWAKLIAMHRAAVARDLGR
jgi:hypothetical protein